MPLPVLIEWDQASVAEWYNLYHKIPRTNLVQTYAYAKAMRQTRATNTTFGIIKHRKGGTTLGLVQAQILKIGFIQRVMIDRGPLWIDPPSDDIELGFWQAVNQTWPRRFGTRRRFTPEVSDKSPAAKHLAQAGLIPFGEGYQTIWMDLRKDLEALRAGLDKKWRNALKKAEGFKVRIILDPESQGLESLLLNYTKDRAAKGYAGASPKFIRAMERYKNTHEYSFILQAETGGGVCAEIYIWVHGHSATYQIGWSDEQGRNINAHYLLLWQAIGHLKKRGIKDFDLGGIDPENAEGVTRFKTGLNGMLYKTAGRYK